MRNGITIPLEPFQNPHFGELIRAADMLGYTNAWTYESFGADAFAPAAAAAVLSERMRIGAAIVPVYTRPAPLIAMSAVTVNQLAGGRFILGLGVSTPAIVEQWMGIPYRKPITKMRETVAALRAIFRGEKVTVDGELVKINGFRLDIPIDSPPKIYIGAQGSKMHRLAGEIADGLIVNFVTPSALPKMLDHTRNAMREAGKDPSTLDVVCRILIAIDEDEALARTLMRRSLTAYVTVPQYNAYFREIGYAAEAEASIGAWQAGDRKRAVECVSEEMVDNIFVIGTAAQCRRRLDEYARAGITATALQFFTLSRDPAERRARIIQAMVKLAAA
ncbi:MAG TPA: LLM class F420-dependent oxidoreductase [Candidatus Binataceae bacterium]|nr:LLM class F420-dependent oxidoreductase [Candidatus Binataceae bacterium]